MNIRPLLLALTCLFFQTGASAAEKQLPGQVTALLQKEFPGYWVEQFAQGDLFGSGSDDLAAAIFRMEKSDGSLIFRLVVVRSLQPNKYHVVESTGNIPYLPPSEFSLRIAKRSLFFRQTGAGMRISEITESQYRHDGVAFVLIGQEQRTVFHGNSPPEDGEDDVRVSSNFLTGTVVTQSQSGTKSEKRTLEQVRLSELGEH